MLAGLEEAELDEHTMHLDLALSSMRAEEAEASAHHLEHFVEDADGDGPV